jgi:hypothetical protein
VANLGHGRRVGVRHRETGPDRLRAFDEQVHRVVLAQALETGQVRQIGHRERQQGVFPLPVGVDRDAAGHEQFAGGRAGQQLGEHRRGLDEPFEIVQDQEHLLPGQMRPQPLQELRFFFSHPQHPGDDRRHEAGVGERAQIDKPDAVGEGLDEVGGSLERQTCLPHAAGPRDGQQPHVVPAQERHDLGHLILAPEKGRRLHRQVVGPGGERADGREVGRQIGMQELEDPFRPIEIAQRVRAEIAQTGARG